MVLVNTMALPPAPYTLSTSFSTRSLVVWSWTWGGGGEVESRKEEEGGGGMMVGSQLPLKHSTHS